MFFFAFIATQDGDASRRFCPVVEWFAEHEGPSGLKWGRMEVPGCWGKRGNYVVGDGTCSVAGGSVRCTAPRE